MRFPGTVTLPPEVFFGVVRNVAQSALTAGFKVVALMGEHGGGQDELALAAKELDAQARPDGARVLFIGDLYAKSRVLMRDILAQRGLPTGEDHAGIPTPRRSSTSKPRRDSGSMTTRSRSRTPRPAFRAIRNSPPRSSARSIWI